MNCALKYCRSPTFCWHLNLSEAMLCKNKKRCAVGIGVVELGGRLTRVDAIMTIDMIDDYNRARVPGSSDCMVA